MEDSQDPDEFWTAQFQSRLLATEGITAFSPSNATALVQSAIDAELDAMYRLITIAKARRNAVAPIFRLPPEVLSHVFAMLAAVDPPGAREIWINDALSYARRLGWIRITHVCRAWRGLALADARLWSRITPSLSPWWVRTLLRRSQNVPFTFDAEVLIDGMAYVDAMSDVVGEVAGESYVRRLKVFRFTSWCLDNMKAALGKLELPAPALESLELRCTAQCDSERMPWPESVFASALPRLRRLALEGWMPSWDAPYLNNLTALELAVPRNWDTRTMDIPKCLEILRASPLLETLVLTRIIQSSAEGDAGHDLARVALPHLKTLALQCSTAGLLVLVRALDIPTTCTVAVALSSSHENFFELLPELVPFAGGPDDEPCAPLRTLSIDCNKPARTREKVLRIKCWDAEDHAGRVPKLSIEYEDLSDTWPVMLQEFVERMRMDAVGVLFISGSEIRRLNKTALLGLLRCLPAVQGLSLVGSHAADAVSVLGKAAKGSGKRAKGASRKRPLVCPALQHIRIVGAALYRWVDSGTFGGVLRGVLLARQSFDAPIASLKLKDCDCAQDELDELKECVGTLESDDPLVQQTAE